MEVYEDLKISSIKVESAEPLTSGNWFNSYNRKDKCSGSGKNQFIDRTFVRKKNSEIDVKIFLSNFNCHFLFAFFVHFLCEMQRGFYSFFLATLRTTFQYLGWGK